LLAGGDAGVADELGHSRTVAEPTSATRLRGSGCDT
jgi:hypothetical protein